MILMVMLLLGPITFQSVLDNPGTHHQWQKAHAILRMMSSWLLGPHKWLYRSESFANRYPDALHFNPRSILCHTTANRAQKLLEFFVHSIENPPSGSQCILHRQLLL